MPSSAAGAPAATPSLPGPSVPRRSFLTSAAAGIATAAMLPGRAHATAADSLAVALIGCGSQGLGVARRMAQVSGVRLAAVCDPR